MFVAIYPALAQDEFPGPAPQTAPETSPKTLGKVLVTGTRDTRTVGSQAYIARGLKLAFCGRTGWPAPRGQRLQAKRHR